MSRFKYGLLYFFYIVGITAIFLYFLFPGKAVKDYLAYHFKRQSNNMELHITDVRPKFPPGLTFEKMVISQSDQPVARLEIVKVTPGLVSLFKRKTSFTAEGKTYDGFVECEGEIEKGNSIRLLKLDGKITDVQLAKIVELNSLMKHVLSGRMDGTFVFPQAGKAPRTVGAKLKISEVNVKLAESVLNMNELDLGNVIADLSKTGKILHISQCLIRGPQADGNVSGDVIVTNPYPKSLLNLSGEIRPHPLFLSNLEKDFPAVAFLRGRPGKNELPFALKGTIEQPNFSIK